MAQSRPMTDVEKAVDKLKWIAQIKSSRTVNPDEAEALLAHIMELQSDVIERQDRLARLRGAVQEMIFLTDIEEAADG